MAARNHGGGGPATFKTHGELVQVRMNRARPPWSSQTAAAPPSWTRLIAIRERRARATAVGKVFGRSIERSDTRGGFRTRPSLQGTSRRRKYPTRDDRDERETRRRTHDATEHDDTAPSGNRSRGNLAMAMRRRRSPPPPPPRALARACACARATTRPELSRSGGGAAQCAVQRNDGGGVVPECPRHHTHAAALGCLACAAFRPTVYAHGRRRDERDTTAATRGVMAGGRCQTGGARARAAPVPRGSFPPPEGCFGVASRGRAANAP